MKLFPHLRLMAALLFLLPMSTALPAEEPGEFSAQNETLYLGNMRADTSDDWQTRVWATPYGNWERRQPEGSSAGFQADTFGVMAGFDCRRNSRLAWGWGAGGSWISASGDNGAGHKKIDGFKTMLNAALEQNDWRLQLAAGYGHNRQSIERNGFYGQFAGANHADQWGLRAEFQLKVGSGLFEMQPFAGLDCHAFANSAYDEHRIGGSGAGQSFGKSSKDSFASTLGVRYRWRQTGHLVVWRPELTAAWYHEFGSDELFRSSWLDPFPTLYTYPGGKSPRDHLLFGAGVVGYLGSTMDIFVRYAADIAGDDTAHTVLCGTNWKF